MTANRSIEAHLADHGIQLSRGQGRPDQDPDGAAHTIDPNVDVLRVDRLSGGRRVPLGAWSTFANHGTVNHSTFTYYNADHHASADRVFEAGVRRAGHVPARTAGRERLRQQRRRRHLGRPRRASGPRTPSEVGRREARGDAAPPGATPAAA